MKIAAAHEGLLDIDDVEPFNPAQDQRIFDDIRAVLVRHKALHRFGVTLLHKHFDVFEGERLVEVCDTKSRTLTLQPTNEILSPDESYVETNWRFDVAHASATQLCFADCLKSGTTHKEIHKKKSK